MARRQTTEIPWERVEKLYELGDPAFVDELRQLTDAERLGKFALAWHKDKEPAARHLLLEYLRRPLNAYRHEALVKRLFKRAEKAGDDEVMAHFLVLLDRSVRRTPREVTRTRSRRLKTRDAARDLAARWRKEGYEGVTQYQTGKTFMVQGWLTETAFLMAPDSTMPRPRKTDLKKPQPIDPKQRAKLEGRRLFSPHTRHYLRRRAWRYFRTLGKEHPERYVPAVSVALKLYEDTDASSGLALMDNWGLMHALFHHSPMLVAKATGWRLAPEQTLANLAPAPMFEELWTADPQALLRLLREARCRPVRRWTIFMLRRDHGAILRALPLETVFDLLGHEDGEVADLAAEVLRDRPEVKTLPVERWLRLIESANPQALEVVCELMTAHLKPEQLTLAQVVQLAAARPLPVARLGLAWLQGRTFQTEEECRALLGLAEAQAEPLRPAVVGWVRQVLSASPYFRPEWVLEYFDSPHPDVRAEGWRWLHDEPRARDDVGLWQRLFESPYDDVRLLLIAELEDRVAQGGEVRAEAGPLDPELLRLLWATVLLNIHRGGRSKPVVLRQMQRRLERKPDEAPALLPLLAVALRSVRGPEWRAGLATVVQLAERHPDLGPVIRKGFPELELA
ncbi:MAG: hypothetical protein L0Z62_34985 [Gemmataceae bacterium]|nr:hypothetical protein [Gemmataceae bacterium]